MIKCELNEPKTFDGSPAETKQDFWQFSEIKCFGDLDYSSSTFPAYLEKIENSEKSFFLEKNISYGDFLTIAFLILIFLGLTIGGIREFAKNRKLERL